MDNYNVRHYTNDTSDGKVYGSIATTTVRNITEVKKEEGFVIFVDADGNENKWLNFQVLSYEKIEGA